MKRAVSWAVGVLVLATASPISAQSAGVERFTVPGPGSVNSWWIDAPAGLIIIDFQRDTASAGQAIARIKASGRPVAALLLTHPHPDHIGGIAQFRAAFPNAPLYAGRGTISEIRSDSRGYQKLTRTALKDKAPARFPLPDRVVEPGSALTLGGLRIEPRELGSGESVAMTVYYVPERRALFAGDVASTGMTDFLAEGRTKAWLENIETLRRSYPEARTLFPGHGASGAPGPLLDETAKMLTTYREEVAAVISAGQTTGAQLTAAGVKSAAAALTARLGTKPPVAEMPNLVEENVKAVGAELLAERRR